MGRMTRMGHVRQLENRVTVGASERNFGVFRNVPDLRYIKILVPERDCPYDSVHTRVNCFTNIREPWLSSRGAVRGTVSPKFASGAFHERRRVFSGNGQCIRQWRTLRYRQESGARQIDWIPIADAGCDPRYSARCIGPLSRTCGTLLPKSSCLPHCCNN
jgi:hypothetical protein